MDQDCRRDNVKIEKLNEIVFKNIYHIYVHNTYCMYMIYIYIYYYIIILLLYLYKLLCIYLCTSSNKGIFYLHIFFLYIHIYITYM